MANFTSPEHYGAQIGRIFQENLGEAIQQYIYIYVNICVNVFPQNSEHLVHPHCQPSNYRTLGVHGALSLSTPIAHPTTDSPYHQGRRSHVWWFPLTSDRGRRLRCHRPMCFSAMEKFSLWALGLLDPDNFQTWRLPN